MTTDIQIQYDVLSQKGLKPNQKSIHLRISESKNMYVIHRALVKQLHKKRQGNANCKTRSEVRGGGKKPWKQKGTGKARAGSIRSPLWKGGGVIFGPKTKEYTKKINKKEQQLAIRNLLYNKKNQTIIIDNTYFESNQPNTKLLLENINKLKINNTDKIIIVLSKKDVNTYLSIRNLKNIELIQANQLNLISIIRAKYLVITEESLDIIQKVYNE
uniref:Large ribosomal subunit protein uL4c n=1 Tax=Calliarthron tuberculosum TaxID=48942 RepID=M4IUZ4_CALTB|nr:50S ribosomal protein L4 [Calliarthron tuberculosum]AGA63839.1 50S ribosomal protein L4 [Calliarthron tuberculosum]